MKHILITVLIISAVYVQKSAACTSAIITGKATQDGRPLMWKHRDTGTENSRTVYVRGAKYSYIGLVNSNDQKDEEIWAGTNSAGFCIMNTASYNMKDLNDTTKIQDREGIVMRMALECCATVGDFERFLDTITKPVGIEANFGVIDAFGGAAYYETNNFSYNKYDVNDPEIAPNNYIIRTNYSYSGHEDKGMGYIRHENAKYLFENRQNEKFTAEWLISSASRSYYHSLLNHDLQTVMPQYAIDQDYIPRKSSASSTVFQGVRHNEPPERTTMWTVIGFPPCSVVVPLWVKGG
ncbi:MAG: C45 family peptidase, partial [Prevotellaceae bacterium]|nr:C45 family peptidase [Prevotellaceae bacterium]